MRSTRNMRNSATPSAPLPMLSSRMPEMTMTPSITFQAFPQYHIGPYATCFSANSTMKTHVKVNSHQ